MKKNRIYKDYVSLFLLVLIFISSNIVIKSKNSNERIADKISSSLIATQNKHDSIASYFKENYETITKDPKKIFPTEDKNNIAAYLFTNDSLIYWNSDINDPASLLQLNSKSNIYKQGHYDYYVAITSSDSLKIFTSTPLCHHNPYLENNDNYIPEKINGSYNINFCLENEKLSYQIVYHAKMNDLESYILGLLLIIIFTKSLALLWYKISDKAYVL